MCDKRQGQRGNRAQGGHSQVILRSVGERKASKEILASFRQFKLTKGGRYRMSTVGRERVFCTLFGREGVIRESAERVHWN